MAAVFLRIGLQLGLKVGGQLVEASIRGLGEIGGALGGLSGGGGSFGAGVRTSGLRELQRDLGGARSDFGKDLTAALKDAAEPIRASAASTAAQWGSKTASGYAVSVRGTRAYVRQRRRKTTGQHPEFGALQMREALLPAVASQEGEVFRRVERAVDDVLRRHKLL